MIRNTLWKGVGLCAIALMLAGCGSDNGPILPRTRLAPQLNTTGLYGKVRFRTRGITSATAPVTVKVGNVTSSSATIAFADTSPKNSDGLGGAVDFIVPTGLSAGAQSLVVTVNGTALTPYTVSVVKTNPFATFTLGNGKTFVAELRQDKAPNTVANFIGLATGTKTWTPTYSSGTKTAGGPMNTPLYDGLKFHRVIPGFVWQTGDPITKQANPPSGWAAGTGGPGFTIPFEDTGLLNEDGALAMARLGSSTVSGDPNGLNTGSSQIYFDNGAQHSLDTTHDGSGTPTGGYVVFGMVVEGRTSLNTIAPTEDASGNPTGNAETVLSSVVISGKLETPAASANP